MLFHLSLTQKNHQLNFLVHQKGRNTEKNIACRQRVSMSRHRHVSRTKRNV